MAKDGDVSRLVIIHHPSPFFLSGLLFTFSFEIPFTVQIYGSEKFE
jgi:hypothetical protein